MRNLNTLIVLTGPLTDKYIEGQISLFQQELVKLSFIRIMEFHRVVDQFKENAHHYQLKGTDGRRIQFDLVIFLEVLEPHKCSEYHRLVPFNYRKEKIPVIEEMYRSELIRKDVLHLFISREEILEVRPGGTFHAQYLPDPTPRMMMHKDAIPVLGFPKYPLVSIQRWLFDLVYRKAELSAQAINKHVTNKKIAYQFGAKTEGALERERLETERLQSIHLNWMKMRSEMQQLFEREWGMEAEPLGPECRRRMPDKGWMNETIGDFKKRQEAARWTGTQMHNFVDKCLNRPDPNGMSQEEARKFWEEMYQDGNNIIIQKSRRYGMDNLQQEHLNYIQSHGRVSRIKPPEHILFELDSDSDRVNALRFDYLKSEMGAKVVNDMVDAHTFFGTTCGEKKKKETSEEKSNDLLLVRARRRKA